MVRTAFYKGLLVERANSPYNSNILVPFKIFFKAVCKAVKLRLTELFVTLLGTETQLCFTKTGRTFLEVYCVLDVFYLIY